MKKPAIVLFGCLVICLCGVFSLAQAQQSRLNAPGSLLVFPLIDNRHHKTILKIANLSDKNVTLGYFIVYHEADPTLFIIKDGLIKLTGQEIFGWNTALGTRKSENFIPPYPTAKGFMVVWATGGSAFQDGNVFDHLIGDAMLFDQNGALTYNGIPHQAVDNMANSFFQFNGRKYTQAPLGFLFEGYSRDAQLGAQPLPFRGTLAVCSLYNAFFGGDETGFTINFWVCNEQERCFSRHKDFYLFQQYSLTDLDITRNSINGNIFQASAAANRPMWAVFLQSVGLPNGLRCDWATNVWQHVNSKAAGAR